MTLVGNRTRRSASRKSFLRPRRPRLDSACAKCNVLDLRRGSSRGSASNTVPALPIQPPIPTGQPPHAAPTQSGRREGQRKHLRNCLSALGPAPRTQPSHRGHCPWPVSVDLVDPAPRSPLPRTRSSGYQTISTSTHRQNDPLTPQARLPSRTTKFATR